MVVDTVTPAEAAELIGVSAPTVYRWISEGRLGAYRVGPKLIRISMSEIERIIDPEQHEGPDESGPSSTH